VIGSLIPPSGGGGGGGGGNSGGGSGGLIQSYTKPDCAAGYIAVKWLDGHWTCEPASNGGGGGGLLTFASGGVMPYTGLAQLHAGETVIPVGGGGGGGGGINLTINLSGNIAASARELAEIVADEVGSVLIRKTSMNRSLAY
jgi:hypothetical protein